MNRISKQIMLAAALTLTAGLTVFAQVTFNDRVGAVEVHGSATDGEQTSMYLKQPPAASGGFALLEDTGEADQGGLHAESTARLTQNLTFDPVNGLPRLVVEGTATALASSMGTVEGADRASAHAQVFYSLDFSLSSPQFVQLSGILDAVAHSGNVQLGLANIVGIDPDGGFLYGDIGTGAFADHRGIQFQPIGLFETLPAGRYELLAFGSAGPRLTKFEFDHGFSELTGKANFSFVLDFASAPPQGNVIRWIEPAGGTFGQTQNWDPQQVPEKSTSRSDTALFELAANYAVNINGARTIERLVVRNGHVDLGGNTLTVAALSTTAPSVSIENAGRLNIAAGGLKSVHAIIGNAPPQDPANPPTAEVLVSNVVPGWDTTGNLAVGGAGRGRLFVAGGGFVKSGSATIGGPSGGEAIVGGQDSFWNSGNLGVGLTGQGTLTVENAGEVVAGNVVLGDGAGASGTIIVDGVNNFSVPSMLTANGNGIVIGRNGQGTLRVENGGNVRAKFSLSVGNGGNGSGALVVRGFHAGSGQRSSVSVTPVGVGGFAAVTIGESPQATTTGPGDMLIENGGLVTSVGGAVGFSAPDTATVRGLGNGKPSEWRITDELDIGEFVIGLLNLQSGGLVSAGNITLGGDAAGNGSIVVDGVGAGGVASTLKATGSGIVVGKNGHGELLVEKGGKVESRFGLSVGFGGGGSGRFVVRGFDAGSGQRSTVSVIPVGNFGSVSIGESPQATTTGPGEMLIENGGLVTSIGGSVGFSAPGTAAVRGLGNGLPSEWRMTGDLDVGEFATGSLDIQAGGLVSAADIDLGSETGGNGSIIVHGVGAGGLASTLKGFDTGIVLGRNGQGIMNVEDGGAVEAQLNVIVGTGGSGNGNLVVRGFDAGSGKRSTVSVTPLVGVGIMSIGGSVGASTTGPGEMLIENGALVTSVTGDVGVGAPGTVTVRGLGNGLPSEWRMTGDLVVGGKAPGLLRIRSGGSVSASLIELGKDAGGHGTIIVDGVGTGGLASTLKAASFAIGSRGDGVLQVEDGGTVEAQFSAIVGNGFSGNGSLVVRGFAPGGGKRSTFSLTPPAGLFGDLSVGASNQVTSTGPGEMLVDSGALVTSVTGAVGAGAPGTAIVRGSGNGLPSEWKMTDHLDVGSLSNGTVTVENGGRVQANEISVGIGGQVLGNGTLAVDPAKRVINGGFIAPGLSPGTLTVQGNYEQTASGRLDIEVAGTSAGQFDVLNVTGNAKIGGGLRLKFVDGFAPRQGDAFEFLDVGGTLANSFANVELRNLAPAFQFEVRSAGGAMTMVALNDGVFVPPPPSVWNVDAGGNWSTAANWTVDVPNAAGDVAIFGDKITAPRTVNVNVPVTLGRIEFSTAEAYTIGGSQTITLNSQSISEEINVTIGSHTISAPLTLADNTLITVAPAAAGLSITGPVSANNVTLTKAGAGKLTIDNLRAAALSIAEGTVAVALVGTDANVPMLGALSIAGGAVPTAKLDLTNSAAILNYTGTSPVATIRQQILASRGGAGLGKGWNGMGITSSTAAAANATDAESRSVGFAENSALPLGPYTTFRGQSVDDTSILMAFTRTGDANLDGLVNDDDVTIVGATYAPLVPHPSWALGDFDYNGFVDDDDVTLLGAFYDPSAIPLAVSPAAAASGVAAVPEPGSRFLLAIAALALALALQLRKLNLVVE